MSNKNEINTCPLCKRNLKEGISSDKHHLIPKSQGGKEVILLHRVCHQKIHSLFSEKELAKKYNTIPLLLSHEGIKNFVKWVQKKPIDFIDINFTSNRKRR